MFSWYVFLHQDHLLEAYTVNHSWQITVLGSEAHFRYHSVKQGCLSPMSALGTLSKRHRAHWGQLLSPCDLGNFWVFLGMFWAQAKDRYLSETPIQSVSGGEQVGYHRFSRNHQNEASSGHQVIVGSDSTPGQAWGYSLRGKSILRSYDACMRLGDFQVLFRKPATWVKTNSLLLELSWVVYDLSGTGYQGITRVWQLVLTRPNQILIWPPPIPAGYGGGGLNTGTMVLVPFELLSLCWTSGWVSGRS